MDSYNIFNTEKVSVSVIIPCYQCTSTIQRAVDSVAQQSLLPREVILVDDASDDETLEMLYSIQKSYGSNWVKVLSLKTNGGPSLARNAAWELVDSSYVAFLDADDSWHPQKIEIQFSWMHAHSEVELTGHLMAFRKSNEKNTDEISSVVTIPLSKTRFLLSNQFSTPTVMMRSNSKFRFDEKQRYAEDYLLWLTVLFSSLSTVFLIEENLAYMYKAAYGESGISNDLWAMEKGELSAYKKIYDMEYIKRYEYWLLSCYSFIKFLRRIVIRALKGY